MTIAYSSVACAEEYGTLKEDINNDGTTCSVTLRCAWTARASLINDIVGARRAWPHSSFPVQPIAMQAGVVPAGNYVQDGQACAYAEALVTIVYSTLIKDLITETLEPTAEFLTLDWKNFRWGSGNGDPLLEKEAPGRLYKSLNLVRVMADRTPPFATGLLTQIGNVNGAAYTSSMLGLTFAAETLLFQPPNIQRTVNTAGVQKATITTKFSFKPQGWNKYWRAATQQWERIFVYNGAEYKNYPLGDFSAFLF